MRKFLSNDFELITVTSLSIGAILSKASQSLSEFQDLNQLSEVSKSDKEQHETKSTITQKNKAHQLFIPLTERIMEPRSQWLLHLIWNTINYKNKYYRI